MHATGAASAYTLRALGGSIWGRFLLDCSGVYVPPQSGFSFLSARCWQVLRCNAGPMGRITGGCGTFGGHLAAFRGPSASRQAQIIGRVLRSAVSQVLNAVCVGLGHLLDSRQGVAVKDGRREHFCAL